MVKMRNETTPLLPLTAAEASAPASAPAASSTGKIIGACILAGIVLFAVAGPAGSAMAQNARLGADPVQATMSAYQQAQIENSQAHEAEVTAKLRYDDASKAARQAQIAYSIARQEAAAALRASSDDTAAAADAENEAESGIAFQTHNDFMLSKEDLNNKEQLYKNARTASYNATTAKHDAEAALTAAKNAQAAAQSDVDNQQKVLDTAQADAIAKEKTSSSLLDAEQAAGPVGEEDQAAATARAGKVAAAEAAATAAEEKAKDEAQKLAQLKSVLAEKKLATANAETVKDNCVKDEADAKAESNQKEQEYLEAAHQHALIEVSAQTEARRAEASIYNSSMTMAQSSIAATNAEKAAKDAKAFSELKDVEEQAAADALAKAQAASAVASANLAARRDNYILAVKVAYSTSLTTTGTIHVVGAPTPEFTGNTAAAPAAGPTASP